MLDKEYIRQNLNNTLQETNFVEVIDMLNNYVLKPAGIKLFVENKKSLLSQVLPVWNC